MIILPKRSRVSVWTQQNSFNLQVRRENSLKANKNVPACFTLTPSGCCEGPEVSWHRSSELTAAAPPCLCSFLSSHPFQHVYAWQQIWTSAASRCSSRSNDARQHQPSVFVSAAIRYPACYTAAVHNVHHLTDSVRHGSLCSQDTVSIQLSRRMLTGDNGLYRWERNTKPQSLLSFAAIKVGKSYNCLSARKIYEN